jgi:hypothetical protein
VHVADTAQETLQGIQARPVDSYGLVPVRGHVPEPEPELEPEPEPLPVLELAPASSQRPDCCTWAAADHVDRLTMELLRFETTARAEDLDCGVAAAEAAVAVAVRGDEDEEN